MSAAIFALNRILEREAWARERLAPFAGRTVQIACGPASVRFSIATSGLADAAETAPDLTLRVSALGLPSLLAHPQRFDEYVSASGDPALASTLAELVQTLPWFVDEAFVRLLGPLAGPAVAGFGRRILEAPAYVGARLADNLARYAVEEVVPAVKRAGFGAFTDGVVALAARIDALDQRMAKLAATDPR